MNKILLVRYLPVDDRLLDEYEDTDLRYAGLLMRAGTEERCEVLREEGLARMAALTEQIHYQVYRRLLVTEPVGQSRLREMHRVLPPVWTRLRLLWGATVVVMSHPEHGSVWYMPLCPRTLETVALDELYWAFRKSRFGRTRKRRTAEEMGTEEAAAHLNVSVDTLNGHVRAGRLPRRNVSPDGASKGPYLYKVADLDKLRDVSYRRIVPGDRRPGARPRRAAAPTAQPNYDHLDL